MTTKQKRKSFQRLTLKPKKDIEEIKLGIKLGEKKETKNPRLGERDVQLYLMGINTELQVGDIVKLKVEDVKGKNSFIFWKARQQKTESKYQYAI